MSLCYITTCEKRMAANVFMASSFLAVSAEKLEIISSIVAPLLFQKRKNRQYRAHVFVLGA